MLLYCSRDFVGSYNESCTVKRLLISFTQRTTHDSLRRFCRNFFVFAVFRQNLRFCYSWCRVKTLTFCNISVISEDIYLKLKLCVHYPKSNPYYQGKQFIFFLRTMPLFPLIILYQAVHSQTLAPECGALVPVCDIRIWQRTILPPDSCNC